ncbi:transcription antitermination factor NusB [Campylobacter canadensis]|uniref:Transcription antitermination factor NusB n=1 Tax=Campylobacter canadensis TaxID=449520 RepID=A0ABS7WS00_9BACT|nr:transcription antitermination factor NusB [Campylobacter canadensis]MBZ7987524.1 transcription antitermination factor NusB [Campylobacter canadensis]MBZ7994867.1 transcription antitermination factor NusB [Campylobacter canadensis]MBZ7996349.1 transcription antitermination factor NusB [Campylobacter canadensis]MBZ7998382.1 transcription antitermination factor NusB [Campylobacter canadensis]MBZ8000097.1 transcription antitermination factor NusB [Campylobacter canadensis]
MATRHQVRKSIISILYSQEFVQNDKFLEDFLEEHKIRNAIKDWAIELYNGINVNLKAIDEKIASLLDGEFNKLANMEKAILRLGVYELLYTNTDKAIIINEAIELAKEYASDNAPKLINGVLDKIR